MGLRLNNRRKPTPNKRPRPTQGLDPQRTAGIRRSFNAEVKRMVGAAVAATSRGMPSFTTNVFCPTGQGGGVDPSCSPGGIYHGTSSNLLENIRKNGLVPKASPGGDQWALKNGWGNYEVTYADIEGRKVSVFVTSDAAQASIYGRRATEVGGGETVVLRVEIPPELLKEDEAGGKNAFRHEGTINPEWIKETYKVDYENDRLIRVDNLLSIYAVIICNGIITNSSSQDVERFEQWFSDLMDRIVLQPSREVIARYVDLSFRTGSGRVFDDFHSGRPRVGEPVGLREGMRKQFVEDLAGHPQTIVTLNSFCPTGKGGGIDPTCSPSGYTKHLDALKSVSAWDGGPSVLSMAAEGKNTVLSGEPIKKVHEKLGNSPEDVQKLKDLLRRHSLGGSNEQEQKVMDQPLIDAYHSQSSLGKTVRDHVKFETALLRETDRQLRSTTGKGVVLYRKGTTGHGGVESWTTSSKGADISPLSGGNTLKPNLKMTVSEMLSKGYVAIGGVGWMTGSPGESEVTLIHDPKRKPVVNAFGFIGRAADKVRTITARVYNDLKSVVQGIVSRGTRVVADAVEKNKEPSQVTRQVLEEVKRGLDGMITTAGDAVSRGFVAGQIAALRQLGVRSVTPAVEWTVRREVDGTIAKTVCKLCRPLDGLIFTVDEAEGLFPRHPKCLPGDSLVLSRSGVSAASKRWYDGDLVVFKTASGRELSCTPNHPVLTDIGWVAAGRLDVGSNVVCDGGREWEGVVNDDRKDVPTSIHDVTEAFRSSRQVTTSEVPLSAPDFHGDGGGSEIAIVWSDGKLRNSLNSSFSQQITKDLFVRRRHAVERLSPRSRATAPGFLRSRTAPSRCVSCGDLVGSLGVGHASPPQSLSVSAGPYLNVSDSQRHPDGRPPHVVATSDGLLGLPSDVTVNRIPERVSRPTRLVDFPPQEIEEDVERDAQLAREILQGASGPVYLDNVVSVVIKKFSGHVYNLETDKGFYAANGIITHNCQCSLMIPTRYGVGRRIRVDSKDEIEDAIARSRGKAKSQQGWAKDVKISKVRPTRNVFCPTGAGGGVDPSCGKHDGNVIDVPEKEIDELVTKAVKKEYPRIKKNDRGETLVDGRKVVWQVPNQSSISSSLEDYDVLPGLREVQMDQLLTYRDRRASGEQPPKRAGKEEERLAALTEQIRKNNKISGLIVVEDGHPDGPYVLEGSHRIDALDRVGAKSFPAMVVIDRQSVWDRLNSGETLHKRFNNIFMKERATVNEWSAPSEVVNAYSSLRTAAGLGLQQQEQSNGHGL